MTAIGSFRPTDIRNIVLLGHNGSGKTTLAEAILHRCGAITRMGSVTEGNTTADYEPEARAHGFSVSSTLLFAMHQGREINLIDTPGAPELIGQALAAMPAVETAVIVINALSGIELGARRLYHAAGEMGLARMIVVNKIDQAEPGDLPKLVAELRDGFGPEVHCINLPCNGGKDVVDCFDLEAGEADFGSVAEVHREMLESTIEVDDAAVERYLGGEAIDLESLRRYFIEAMNRGHVVPILFTAASSEVGIDDLLHVLVEEAPSPSNGQARRLKKDGEVIEVKCDPDAPLLAHVFKVTTDPYLGKLAMIRILQGRLDATTQFSCAGEKKTHKASHVLKVEGRDHPEVESVAYAGDIVALAKVDDIHINQVLRPPGLATSFEPILPRFPTPMYSLAVTSTNKNDEVKLSSSLTQLCEEDPTMEAHYDPQTHELVVSGLGEMHLRITFERLENRFRVPVTVKQPRIAYRETITGNAEGHHRHKKQTGGSGQFGEVFLRVEALPRGAGFEFVDDVRGGAIPNQFIGSVEKGVRAALPQGPLAGYPVQDVRVILYDGKTHAVDGKDVAFQTAGKHAFRDAFAKARPMLLEPIVALDISCPDVNVGDITADLKTRRGRVVGVDVAKAGVTSLIHAQVPLGELGNYSGTLRGLTAGQASFSMEPLHYDFVPPIVQKKLVDAAGAPIADED